MRRAERPAVGQRAVLDLAGDRGDHRDFEQLGRRQRRQDRRQPRRQHRLAGAGRADHQQIVAAGGGDLERALGALLALDVGEVERRALAASRGCRASAAISTCVPLKWLASWISDDGAMISISGLAQAASGPQAAGQIRPSPRALAPIAAGSTPATARDRAVEAELAQHREARQRVVRHRADRRHQAERDRQVVMAAFLRQVGGREIDGDAARRQREPGGDQRGAHPLLGLGHRLVGQADDVEGRQAGRDLHLHVDRAGLDALERHGGDALDHAAPQPHGTVAEPMWPTRTFAEQNDLITVLSHFRSAT